MIPTPDPKEFPRRLDYYKHIIATTQIHAPISQFLNMHLVAVTEGSATFELATQEGLFNSVHTLHGGIISLIADASMGVAFGTYLETLTLFTTVEMKINFIRPVTQGKIRSVGSVIHRGSKTGVVEAKVFDEQNNLVAMAQGTMMVLERKKMN